MKKKTGPINKKIGTVPAKYFKMEEVTVKGFCNFCKNNIPLLIAVSVTLFFSYGIRLFWYSIGADTEVFMSDKPGILHWHMDLGRFGHVLLSKFLHIKEFNPFTAFFTAFCLIWFFTLSWCYLIAIFSGETGRNDKLVPFALMFMTVPVWAEQFYFLLQAAENALIISLCPYVIYLLFKGFLDGEKGKIICASVLLVFMVSVYQAVVLLFCCGVFICFLLLQENSEYEPKIYRNLCLKLFVTLICSLAVYFFIDRVIVPAVFHIQRSSYLDNMNQWGKRSFGRIFLDLFLYCYTLTFGNFPPVQRVVGLVIARHAWAGEQAVDFLNGVSRISGNVLLFPATVLFFVKITQITRKVIPSGRKFLYTLAGIGIPLCTMLLAVTGGGWPPYRSHYALPLASAFMLFFLIKKYKKKAALVVICLTLLVAAYQAQIVAQLFYSDQLRYNEDVRLSYELNDLITHIQPGAGKLPVVFVGKYHAASRFQTNFLQGSMLGRSVFEQDSNLGPVVSVLQVTLHGLAFMRSLGMNFDLPNDNQIERALKEAVSMPVYPDPGYVKRTRDFIVVKLSETL